MKQKKRFFYLLACIVIPAIVNAQDTHFSAQQLGKYISEPDALPVRTVIFYRLSVDGSVNDSSYFKSVVTPAKRPGDIHVPASFSPDGDGKDDKLMISHPPLRSFSFFVYNAKGEKVYADMNADTGWDGMNGPDAGGEGTYVYFLEAVLQTGEKIQQKGAIQLTRHN